MTAQAREILTQLYISQEVDEAVLKIEPAYLRDDVRQQVFLNYFEIADRDPAKIIDLHTRGKMKATIAKSLYNEANRPRSDVNYQNRRATEIPTECFPCTPYEDPKEHEEFIQTVLVKVKDLHWYNRELLTIYAKEGTYRKVEAATGIPLNSVHDAIKKAKNEIKKTIWE
jgi:hypothetical protein